MALFNILVGAAILLFGRRLFWLFVAGVGFVVGAALATQWFGARSDWITLAVALAFGVISALLSVVLQRLVVALSGFLAGGYVLYALALELQHESLAWIALVLGGIVGAILMIALFDWALIVLSALTGATVIVQNLSLDRSASAVLFMVLLVLGVAVQARGLTRKAPAPDQRKPDAT
jgi:hypothetical protein